MALNSSTRFNAFQRAGFVLALSASQSFGDGVYPQNPFHHDSLQRHLPPALNVGQLPVMERCQSRLPPVPGQPGATVGSKVSKTVSTVVSVRFAPRLANEVGT
jgi:hypothetical protein